MSKRNTAILLIGLIILTTVITYNSLSQLENNDDIFATDFDADDF